MKYVKKFKSTQGRDSTCSVPPFSFYMILVPVNDQSDCSKAKSYVLRNVLVGVVKQAC